MYQIEFSAYAMMIVCEEALYGHSVEYLPAFQQIKYYNSKAHHTCSLRFYQL